MTWWEYWKECMTAVLTILAMTGAILLAAGGVIWVVSIIPSVMHFINDLVSNSLVAGIIFGCIGVLVFVTAITTITWVADKTGFL